MATARQKKTAAPAIDANQLMTWYMDDVMQGETTRWNVYNFCKKHQIPEVDFYLFFSSIEALEEDIWVAFFDNALDLVEKEPGYAGYTGKNKLLSLYFTLFEILKLNRSYVLFALKGEKMSVKNLLQLRALRRRFKEFVDNLYREERPAMMEKASKVTAPVIAEAAWAQFLFILKFWMDDRSKGFEKTDIVIEKSVNTVVDLLDTKPLENLIDLGKFLWKEHKATR